MQDGDVVAIIRTGSGIGALQQFTTDKRQLMSAIQKIKFNLAGSGKIGVFNPITPTFAEQLNGTIKGDGSVRDLNDKAESDREFEHEINEFRESIFASGTLGSLNYIIRGMRDLPGRKSIIMLSDGIRMFVRDERGIPQTSRIVDSLRRLTDLANRASVVVYTVDAKGLVFTGLTAEDSTMGLSAFEIERRLEDRRNEFLDTREGLTYLSRQTGGFAIINNNDIPTSIRRILDDQSYYLIGYQPDDDTFDPKTRQYNKLEVRVTRPGARVHYRSGFFGISDEQIKRPQLTASQTILNALTSPFAVNDISLHLNALFAVGPKKEAYLRSFLHVEAEDLTFTRDADGSYKTDFDLVAMSFGDNGILVDELSKTYTLTLKEEAYQKMRKKGFVYQFTFPVKKPGGYQVRVALRDSAKNTVGSANQFVEIPNMKKNRLVLSGIALETMETEQWEQLAADSSAYEEIKESTDALSDTTLRQFKVGRVLRYGVDIYNSKTGDAGKPDLTKQIKIYRDGKLFLDGPPRPVDSGAATGAVGISSGGGIRWGKEMPAGEYVLQILITDNFAKGKRRTASQFAQFEIVE